MPNGDNSPVDIKTARINAVLRVLIVTAVVVVVSGVVYTSVGTYLTTRSNHGMAQTLLTNQTSLQHQLHQTRLLNDKLLALASDIEDCNTPNGKCYQRRLAELADVTGQTNAVTIAAAACATIGPYPIKQRTLRACVVRVTSHAP